LHFPSQPCLGVTCLSYRSGYRNADGFGRFLDGQAAEVAQLEDSCFALVSCGQRLQSIIERHYTFRVGVGVFQCFIQLQRRLAAASLNRSAGASVVYHDLSHQPGGDSEEMGAALPIG